MRFYADLHVHSKYAYATSRDADLEHLALSAATKGVTVLGTGDFTHPAWCAEMQEKFVPAEPGLYRLRPELERWVARQCPTAHPLPVRFILQTELATLYRWKGRLRKVHHCVYAPNQKAVQRLRQRLSCYGNLAADGRPLLKLEARNLLELVLEAGEGTFLIPAHIWTPWFSVLGSKSGFDSIAECYGDLAPEVFAVETGLSSDPPMNWRLSQLDRFQLVSNSDAHSPSRIAREACVFNTELSYFVLRQALKKGLGFEGTVEFFPEEGKYHGDGHRHCRVCLAPEQTKAQKGKCPVCGQALTVGVLHRVLDLADRPEGITPSGARPFRNLIPLSEVIAETLQAGPRSLKVRQAQEKLLRCYGPELFILEQAPLEEIGRRDSSLLAEGLARLRRSQVLRQPGYDGQYGQIRLFHPGELPAQKAT